MSLHQEPGRHRSRGAEETRAGVGQRAAGEVSRLAALSAALLLLLPGAACALQGDLPQSICNLPPPGNGWNHHLAARLAVHSAGGVLADPLCPGRTLVINDLSPITRFLQVADPDGKRFGAPGAGTYVDVELDGQVNEERVFSISEVRAYVRYDVIDRRWRVNSTEDWIHTAGWQADEQFPFTRESRRLKSTNHISTVHGGLGDETVEELMKLARVGIGSNCQFSESAQSMVRMQCTWQGSVASDRRAWVYARDAGAWRLVQKSDAVMR